MTSRTKPFLLYLIGISGSGKTTIGHRLNEYYESQDSRKVQFIDGDDIRARFGGMFGYTREERMKCNQATRTVAEYLLDNDVSVILTGVVAYEEMRNQIRQQFGDRYIQCYVKCSLEECMRRDPKGYYKKFKEGSISNLNGANDTYEIPLQNEIVVDTEKLSVDESVHYILDYLSKWGR